MVLNFTPPEALKILQAAQQQGLQDRVKWACSTPCNTDFLANALGPQWNGKLGVNAELNLTTADRPGQRAVPRRAEAVRAEHPARQLQPDGLRRGQHRRQGADERIKGEFTVESVNEAIKNVKDFKTDILCKPWYYGDAPLHIPNNTDRTIDAEGRQDGREGGLLPHLRRRPGDRAGPADRGQLDRRGRTEEVRIGCPSWQNFQPFIVTGLALGGVYALSGVGMVVLYRTTGVLNLAFGAVGAMGAFIAWSLINTLRLAGRCRLRRLRRRSARVVTLVYGMLFGPPLAGRDPLVKAAATLGLALILLGAMSWIWSDKARSMVLPTTNWRYSVGEVLVNWTQIIALALGVADHARRRPSFLRHTSLGTAMRALANDREITATLGVPVRRVEAAAWLGLRRAVRASPGCCCPTSSGSTRRR